MSNIKAIVIGGMTYGYYNETKGTFSCTHGSWDCKMSIPSEGMCLLHMSHIKEPVPFKVLSEIPEEFLR